MKALDAKEIANNSKIDLVDVFLAIKKEAEFGNFSANIFRLLSDKEQLELKSLGYKLLLYIDIEENPLKKSKKPIYKISW